MKCSKCNKRIFIKTKYCPSCGTELNYSPKKKKNIKVDKNVLKISIIIIAILLILVLIGLKERYNEKNIAIKYFESVVNKNAHQGFKYLDAEESKFINEKTFKKLLTDNNELKNVINYTIQDINYSNNKEQVTITMSYITKKDKSHQTKDIVLINKGKKYLFFNDWRINTKNMISKNYKLYVPKKYNIKLNNIKVGKSELKSSDKNYYIYEIKNIFIGDYNVSVKYKDMDLESRILVQNNNSYSYINNLFLPQEISQELSKELVGQLETLYKNAIKSKSYKDFKKKLTLAKDHKIKDIYNDLVVTTNYYSGDLKDFKVKQYNIISTKVDDDIHMTIAINYKYKASNYGVIREKNKTDDVEFIVKKEKDKYKLYNIKKLTYYFR